MVFAFFEKFGFEKIGNPGAMGDNVPADAQRDVVNVANGGAPAPGGSSSSSGEPSTETSACEQRREGGEGGRRKRRRVGASDEEGEYESSEVADAINKFTEAYIRIETMKVESRKAAVEHDTQVAKLTLDMETQRYRSIMDVETQRYKCIMDTQLAMAKLVAEAVKGALDRCLLTRDLRDA